MDLLRQKVTIRILPIAIFIIFIGSTAYAAENAGDWRSTYDLAMRWVNFIILAAVLIKFGKTPLTNMLMGQKDNLEAEIKNLEIEKQKAEAKASSAQKLLDDSHISFDKITERITMQGERKKQQIIEDAKRESKVILESAKRKLESQITIAKEGFRAELIDAAISSALEKLPGVIKVEDHQHFLKKYIDSLKI